MTSPPPEASASHPVERVEAEVAVLLRRARRFSAQIARDVHPDIEPGAYSILVRLASTGGERLTDVATAFGVGKPTVSRQVAVLEGLRLLDRSPDPQDARAQVLRLTQEGAARLDRARSARRQRFRELLQQWPEDEVTALADLLHRFNDLDVPEAGAPTG